MSKEKILEEFDKLTPCPDDCGVDYDEKKEWLEKNNHLYHNEVYNEPMYDLSEEKVKEFIEKAIDQTREETIREVNSILPEEMIDNGGDVAFRGFNDCLDQIKQSLKSLINK